MGLQNPNRKGHHSKAGADRTSEPLMPVSMRQWTRTAAEQGMGSPAVSRWSAFSACSGSHRKAGTGAECSESSRKGTKLERASLGSLAAATSLHEGH